jgi:putative chitinase
MNIALLTKIPSEVLLELPTIMEAFEIDTPLRLAHFLSQCAHESGNFKHTVENMNYSEKRLLQVFPKYFPTLESTKGYAMHPERIGNKVYAGRMGNGDEASGHGYKYRGRGYIQVTGRGKFVELDKILTEDAVSNPDIIGDKYPLFASAWFWDAAKINKVADKGNTFEVCEQVTKKVNGGKNGLLNRWRYFVNFYARLTI